MGLVYISFVLFVFSHIFWNIRAKQRSPEPVQTYFYTVIPMVRYIPFLYIYYTVYTVKKKI